jgi:hypothetical protein
MSLADTIISMPSVASRMRTGYSKRSMRSAFMKCTESAIAAAEPSSTRILNSRAKPSTTKAPWNAISRPSVPKMTRAPVIASTTTLAALTRSADCSLRNTPNMSSAMAATARKISGRATSMSAPMWVSSI